MDLYVKICMDLYIRVEFLWSTFKEIDILSLNRFDEISA